MGAVVKVIIWMFGAYTSHRHSIAYEVSRLLVVIRYSSKTCYTNLPRLVLCVVMARHKYAAVDLC